MRTTAAPQRGRLPFTAALLSTLVMAGAFGVGGLLWLLWLFADGGVLTWEQMAWWGPLVVLTTGVAVAAAMGALVLRGWKPRLPVAVFLALGLLPWLVGTLGTRWGVRMCAEAVANVNPLDKATILMAGIQEALVSYLFGGGLSAALLVGLALGLGTAALVLRTGRRERAPDAPASLAGPAASAALLCLAAALAVAACLPSASIHREVFSAMIQVNPADRATLLAYGAESLGPARVLTGVLLGAALVLVMGAALWGRRAGVGVGRAVAAGLCVVPAFAVHVLAQRDMKETARVTVETPWASAGDFQPVPVPGGPVFEQWPRGLVTRTHLVPSQQQPGAPVPLEDGLALALRELIGDHALERAEWEEAAGRRELSLQPQLVLAMDGRVDGAKLRDVLEAARTAGASSLVLVGPSPVSPALARLESEPLMAPFLKGQLRGTAPMALLSALPRDSPAHRPEGWDARLGAASVLTLTPRPGSGEQPMTVDLAQPPPEALPEYGERRTVPVYLTVEEDLTPEQLVRAVEAVSRRSTSERRLVPVLLTTPLPEPTAPVVEDGPR